MSEIEDKIGSILSDPKQMEMIKGLAAQFMGGGDDSAASPAENSAADSSESLLGGLAEGIDPAMISKIMGLMSGAGQGDQKKQLLCALEPFLSPKRREKLSRAMQIAKMAHIAETVFDKDGGIFGV